MAQQIENDKNETTLRLWNPMNTSAPYGSDNTPPLDIESPKNCCCLICCCIESCFGIATVKKIDHF